MANEPSIADLAKTMDRLVEKLQRYDDVCPFDEDEIAQIKRAAHLVEWFDTLGWLGKRLMALIGAIVLLISQWERIAQFFGGAK